MSLICMRPLAAVAALVTMLVPVPAEAAAAERSCGGRRATIVGTKGDDVIRGTHGKDVIAGLAGDDVIKGLKDRDLVCGNGGDDTLFGNTERDRHGNISGPSQRLFGGPGRDTLHSGAYSIMRAGEDDDLLLFEGQFAIGYGGAGDDHLDASGERQRGYLGGGRGADLLEGGPGRGDTITFHGARAPLSVDLTAQTARGHGDDTIAGIDNVIGGDADDALVGNDDANYLAGGGGADRLEGRGGKDSLQGDLFEEAEGGDTLLGGDGDDHFHPDFNTGADDVVDGGAGTDTWDVFLSPSTVDLSAGTTSGEIGNDEVAGIENVIGAGYSDTLIGDDGPNVLEGAGGRDHIEGRGGDDVIVGESGPGERWHTQPDHDTILGGDGHDVISTEGGVDDVDSGAGDDEVDAGGGNDRVTGAEGDDTIDGSHGDDDLDGADGTDVVNGGPGSDSCANAETVSGCEGPGP